MKWETTELGDVWFVPNVSSGFVDDNWLGFTVDDFNSPVKHRRKEQRISQSTHLTQKILGIIKLDKRLLNWEVKSLLLAYVMHGQLIRALVGEMTSWSDAIVTSVKIHQALTIGGVDWWVTTYNRCTSKIQKGIIRARWTCIVKQGRLSYAKNNGWLSETTGYTTKRSIMKLKNIVVNIHSKHAKLLLLIWV